MIQPVQYRRKRESIPGSLRRWYFPRRINKRRSTTRPWGRGMGRLLLDQSLTNERSLSLSCCMQYRIILVCDRLVLNNFVTGFVYKPGWRLGCARSCACLWVYCAVAKRNRLPDENRERLEGRSNETGMSSFWRNFYQWLKRQFSFW